MKVLIVDRRARENSVLAYVRVYTHIYIYIYIRNNVIRTLHPEDTVDVIGSNVIRTSYRGTR